MSEKPPSKSASLQTLIHRRDKVLAVLHPPTAAHARIMEKAGCEALFVGTGGVVGAYTGLSDVGTATMTECVTIAGHGLARQNLNLGGSLAEARSSHVAGAGCIRA